MTGPCPGPECGSDVTSVRQRGTHQPRAPATQYYPLLLPPKLSRNRPRRARLSKTWLSLITSDLPLAARLGRLRTAPDGAGSYRVPPHVSGRPKGVLLLLLARLMTFKGTSAEGYEIA